MRTRGSFPAAALILATELSVEPSLIASNSQSTNELAITLATAASTKRSALCTGITTDTRGDAPKFVPVFDDENACSTAVICARVGSTSTRRLHGRSVHSRLSRRRHLLRHQRLQHRRQCLRHPLVPHVGQLAGVTHAATRRREDEQMIS